MLLAVLAFYYTMFNSGVEVSTSTIKDYIGVEALVSGVNPQLLQGIAERESMFNCKAVGDKGTSFGCFQIHNPETKKIRPITIDQAKDIRVSVNWAIQTIKEDGDCHQWSVCKDVMASLSP